jgi:hypothetical protein
MHFLTSFFLRVGRCACVIMAAFASVAHADETMAVSAEVVGVTPIALGYNLGHFKEDSNAADWFRYSGADSARLFINRKELEEADDKAPWGDGVSNQASFLARCASLRANAANSAEEHSHEFVGWRAFSTQLERTNSYVLTTLRDAGVDVLVNITVGDALDANDWAGRWELWQHYYAVAYVMSSKYGVRRYSMYNEPNLDNKINEDQWLDLLLVCSDAIQSAVQDVNARFKLSLKPEIFAPNTAGGAPKYKDKSQGRWGSIAILNRHRRLDGSLDNTWMNFHVFNYQKYTTRQFAQGQYSGFLTDYQSLRALIDADMQGETELPIALTEFNVQTAANFDRSSDTTDQPYYAASLGATLAGLGGSGIQQIYLFKFGQTAWRSTYGVKKNGTHFVQNSLPYNYGGATRCAEVYRLFIKAARGGRPVHRVTTSSGVTPRSNEGLWSLATRDEVNGMFHLFLANRDDRPINVDFDLSAIGLPYGNPFFIEQVNESLLGGVVKQGQLDAGKARSLRMPPLSVWLISVPSKPATTLTRDAVADTQLRDGAKLAIAGGGSLDSLMVRSDASSNPRHVALIRIPVPTGADSLNQRVLLELDVACSEPNAMAQAHLYGVESNQWNEDTLTWQSASDFLKPNVPVGNQIKHNVVNGHGTSVRMLGQLAANSSSMIPIAVDATDFVRTRHDGMATFLIVQEHRWDNDLTTLASGDTQAAHLLIGSRERRGGKPPRLVAFASDHVP